MSPDARVDSLTPRSIHAYFVTRLSAMMESFIEVDESVGDRITFSVQLKR